MRLILIFIFIFVVSAASAQRTVTFRVKRAVQPASEVAFRMGSSAIEPEGIGLTVGVLCSWLKRDGFTLQNEKIEGSRLSIVSFEYRVNSFVPLLGIHDLYEARPTYNQMVRFLYGQRVVVGDRLYVGWLRVRTGSGDTIKLPDMKFLKI